MATDVRMGCTLCKKYTKYKCIKCQSPACNRFTTFEDDEEAVGWQMGVSVGYCIDCQMDYVNDTTKDKVSMNTTTVDPENVGEDRESLTPSPSLGTSRYVLGSNSYSNNNNLFVSHICDKEN